MAYALVRAASKLISAPRPRTVISRAKDGVEKVSTRHARVRTPRAPICDNYVNRLRNRLIVVFLIATLAPLGVTVWVTTLLLGQSLRFAAESRTQLDEVSRSLERTGREFYQRACASLKSDANARRVPVKKYAPAAAEVREFWDSGEVERFALAGAEGERLEYLVRQGQEVWSYSAPLEVGMQRLHEQIARARESVDDWKSRDWWRGFVYTYGLLAAGIWLAFFGLLTFLASRISRPIQQLTAGLGSLAGGNPEIRVTAGRDDEIGRAIQAFNHMADQLQQNRDRLVYLTQLASWQTLARKMAHEVKNSRRERLGVYGAGGADRGGRSG